MELKRDYAFIVREFYYHHFNSEGFTFSLCWFTRAIGIERKNVFHIPFIFAYSCLIAKQEFSDPRDADDAQYNLDGREVDGSRIIVEFAKGVSCWLVIQFLNGYNNCLF